MGTSHQCKKTKFGAGAQCCALDSVSNFKFENSVRAFTLNHTYSLHVPIYSVSPFILTTRFHTFNLQKPETAAMFFQVPKQTASRLAFWFISTRVEEASTWKLSWCPLVGIAILSLFCPCRCGNEHFFHTRRRVCLRTWEDTLSLRGAPSPLSLSRDTVWRILPH